jgi:hypothetical protein
MREEEVYTQIYIIARNKVLTSVKNEKLVKVIK